MGTAKRKKTRTKTKTRAHAGGSAPVAETKPPNVPPILLSTKEVSQFLGVSRQTIRRLRETNQIPYYRVGNQYRYDVMAVRGALEKTR